MQMKSVGIYKDNELIARHLLDGEIKTVGNNTCDIPIPDEERVLFALEMNADEELGHIYMYGHIPIEVNGIQVCQSPIDIQMGDSIKLDTDIELRLILGEYVPEKKVPNRPPPIVIVPKEMVPLGIEPIKESEKPHTDTKPHTDAIKLASSVTEEEKLVNTDTEEETIDEFPVPTNKAKQTSILDYFHKK